MVHTCNPSQHLEAFIRSMEGVLHIVLWLPVATVLWTSENHYYMNVAFSSHWEFNARSWELARWLFLTLTISCYSTVKRFPISSHTQHSRQKRARTSKELLAFLLPCQQQQHEDRFTLRTLPDFLGVCPGLLLGVRGVLPYSISASVCFLFFSCCMDQWQPH